MNQETPLGQDDPSVDVAQLSSMAAGTLTLTVPCMPAPAAGMGWMQEGNKSGTIEAAVLVWGSALLSPATPSAAILWDSALAASGQVAPVLALRLRQVFYEDGKGT